MGMRSDDNNIKDVRDQAAKTDEDILEKADIEQKSEIDAETLEDQEFEGIKNETNETPQVDSSDDLKKEKFRLEDENKKLSNEVETLKDRLLRTTAEYDNFRRRTAKEKEGIYTDACEDVLKTMLPVLDNLERALEASGSVDDLKKGIEMTIRQFKDSFTKLQVEEISTEGEFDPNFHNAVMHINDENYGKNSIVEVFQKGYKRGSKVLRYSMVKVAN
jgi:molecular chaperone GrpE